LSNNQTDLKEFTKISEATITDAGMKKVEISEIGEIVTGNTPSTKEEGNYGGEIPFIRVSDFSDDVYIRDTEKTLTEKGANEVKNKEIPEYAVMVSCIGNGLGKTAMADRKCFTNQQINSVIPSDSYHPWYVYYLLTTKQEKFQNYAGGSAQPILSKTKFGNIEVEVHSDYKVQKKIGNTLRRLDEKRNLNEKINENLDGIIETVYTSWFVEFDTYEGELIYDEELENERPADWDRRSLDEIANFLNGQRWQKFEAEDDAEETLPVIKIVELRDGIQEDSDRVNREEAPEDYFIRAGDVVFSWSASLVLDIWKEEEAFLNQHLFKVTSDKFPRWFYYMWIRYHLQRFRHIADSRKTTMGHIKREHLEEAKVLIPDDRTLEKMNEIMSPILELQVNSGKENGTLAELRDTLLPKLMSGEMRLDPDSNNEPTNND